MPCYRPIEIPVKAKGHKDKPWAVSQMTVVPCGNCVGCRGEQGRQWAVRMMHESRMHDKNLFVTLTIADENLNANSELRSKDFSTFVRRMRKAQEKKFSFFGCGEYGERTGRPHYHALLFGVEFLDRCDRIDDTGREYEWSQTLEDLWGLGICELGRVSMASASYVAGYVRKKVKAKNYVRCNPITGELLNKEFARMSLRPAIGKRWIEKWWQDVYPRDFVVVDGVEAKPPRFYDKWMDKNQPKLMEKVRDTRWAELEELSKYKLMSGEKIAQTRLDLFQTRHGV